METFVKCCSRIDAQLWNAKVYFEKGKLCQRIVMNKGVVLICLLTEQID